MTKAASALLFLLLGLGLGRAQILYNNGSDPGVYSWQINFGYAVTNSFVLTNQAHVDHITVSVWDVDDQNTPMAAEWKITTAPFGGRTIASGSSFLGLIEGCQQNRHLFCQWEMAIHINADLPAGTYWLQIQNMQTNYHTDAFWGQSGGQSRAYIYAGENPSGAVLREIPSESFQVLGTP
jgi:hypothetical protein